MPISTFTAPIIAPAAAIDPAHGNCDPIANNTAALQPAPQPNTIEEPKTPLEETPQIIAALVHAYPDPDGRLAACIHADQYSINQTKEVLTSPNHNATPTSIAIKAKSSPSLEDIEEVILDLARQSPAGKKYMAPSPPTEDLPGRGLTATYSRRSSAKLDAGGSRERQEDDQDATVVTYGLPPIVQRFYDDGITGTTTDRPSYQNAKSFIAANRGCNMVIERVDRAVRSGIVGFDFGYFLIENDVQLYDSNGLVSPERLLQECASASGVAKHIAERNYEARVRAIKRGVFFPEAPFGYFKPKVGILAPRPKLVPVIQEIFQMRLQGKTHGQISRWLQENGILTARGNLEWSISSIHNILRNPIYVGITVNRIPRTNEKWPVKTLNTQIVDSKDFLAVQAMRAASKRGKNKGANGGHRSLLATKTICPVCGSSWEKTFVFNGNDGAMRCHRTRFGCTGMPLVSRNWTERIAIASLAELVRGDEYQQSFLSSLEKAEAVMDVGRDAARANLEAQIKAEKEKLQRATEDAYKLQIMSQMAPVIKAGQAKLDELTARRIAILPIGYALPVSRRLKSLGAALAFAEVNVPLKRSDSDAEEVIAAISSVIVSVSVEHLMDGRVKQTTVFDFNMDSDEVRDPSLLRSVSKTYAPPVFDARTRQKASIEWNRHTGRHDVSDTEAAVLMDLPIASKFFASVPPEEMRRGLNAMALMLGANVIGTHALEAYGVGKGTAFHFAYQNMRTMGDVGAVVDCFKRLRKGPMNERALLKAPSGERGYLRLKLSTYNHPILGHPLCQEGGRAKMTDVEWRAITCRMHRYTGFSGLKTMALTRRQIEQYFHVVRTGLSWHDVVPHDEMRSAGRRIRQMMKNGAFDEVCRILLIQAGQRSEDDRTPLPVIPSEKISLTRKKVKA